MLFQLVFTDLIYKLYKLLYYLIVINLSLFLLLFVRWCMKSKTGVNHNYYSYGKLSLGHNVSLFYNILLLV